jgi:translation initiation factor 2 subunit 2
VADPEVDLFAGMKKKKKKQVVLDTEESSPAPAATEEKSEQPAATSAPAPAEAAAAAPVEETKQDESAEVPAPATDGAEGEGGDLFADMKKKKKKKKEIPLDLVSALVLRVLRIVCCRLGSRHGIQDLNSKLEEYSVSMESLSNVLEGNTIPLL